MKQRKIKQYCALAAVSLLFTSASQAATAVWFDGFDTSAGTSNINQDLATRQGGSLATISYVANTGDPTNDYHHQMFGSGPLQLAGDAGVSSANSRFSAIVSPNYNFTGTVGGEIVGKQIELGMDVFTNNPGSANYFSSTSITVGANSALQAGTAATSGFSIVFTEQDFGSGASQTIEFWDGTTQITVVPFVNPAGVNPMFIQIFINDLADGNPWDGVGSTTIGLSVDSTPVGSYTKPGGGYTNNFISLEGSSNTVGVQLATHTFDNLTVYSDVVPEPSSALLGGLFSLLAMVRRRRV